MGGTFIYSPTFIFQWLKVQNGTVQIIPNRARLFKSQFLSKFTKYWYCLGMLWSNRPHLGRTAVSSDKGIDQQNLNIRSLFTTDLDSTTFSNIDFSYQIGFLKWYAFLISHFSHSAFCTHYPKIALGWNLIPLNEVKNNV